MKLPGPDASNQEKPAIDDHGYDVKRFISHILQHTGKTPKRKLRGPIAALNVLVSAVIV